MRRFATETIEQAKRTDLYSYLTTHCGEQFRKLHKSGEYQHETHKSLYINGYKFSWHSQDKRGNAIDFMMAYYGMTFVDAVKELTSSTGITVQAESKLETPIIKEIETFEKAADNKRVIAYLKQTRHIEYKTILKCLNDQILCQDIHGNAMFLWFDNNKIVGGDVVGTLSTQRFKRVLEGSWNGYGFTIKTSKNPNNACFFESPIDLLSYYDLLKKDLPSHYLISLGGVREDNFTATIDRLGIDPQNSWICTDNDDAGKLFAEKMAEIYGTKTKLPPTPHKDWNDLLKATTTM